MTSNGRPRLSAIVAASSAALVLLASCVGAPPSHHAPWRRPGALLVIDAYHGAAIEWDQLAADTDVRAVIHKASEGLTADPAFEARAARAKARGLLWGAYHVGRPGDPVRQANLLLTEAKRTGAGFLALDIEGLDPARDISLADAAIFIGRVHAATGRWPTLYIPLKVYDEIVGRYDETSVFAHTALWLARYRDDIAISPTPVWRDYALWQFQSGINCKPDAACPRRVIGTDSGMDVSVFNGDERALAELFGARTPGRSASAAIRSF